MSDKMSDNHYNPNSVWNWIQPTCFYIRLSPVSRVIFTRPEGWTSNRALKPRFNSFVRLEARCFAGKPDKRFCHLYLLNEQNNDTDSTVSSPISVLSQPSIGRMGCDKSPAYFGSANYSLPRHVAWLPSSVASLAYLPAKFSNFYIF